MVRVLDELCSRDWLSDRRFAEQYVAARRKRGYGPLRIRGELEERGVEGAIRSACVDERDPAWREEARRALGRRFRATEALDPEERNKRARFLARRGYDSDQIRSALDDGE